MAYFTFPEEVRELFPLDKKRGYFDAEVHETGNGEIVYCVKRFYPSDIDFIPAKTKYGKPDTVAFIAIGFAKLEGSASKKQLENRLPVFVSVEKYDRYKIDNQYREFNFDDEKCPTRRAMRISQQSIQPWVLRNNTDFLFDFEQRCFVTPKGEKYSGRDFLDHLFKIHILPALRLPMPDSDLLDTCSSVEKACRFVLDRCFGREPAAGLCSFSHLSGDEIQLIKKSAFRLIPQLEYETTPRTVLTWAVSLLFAGTVVLSLGQESAVVQMLLSATLLQIALGVVWAWFVEFVAPKGVARILNWAVVTKTHAICARDISSASERPAAEPAAVPRVTAFSPREVRQAQM